MVVPKYFFPSHLIVLIMTFSILQKGVVDQRLGYIYIYIYIYIYLCFHVTGPCLCNMWIGLETSRTESLVVFNLCYQLSFADFFVQKKF